MRLLNLAIIILIIVNFNSLSFNDDDIEYIRTQFYLAVEQENVIDPLLEHIHKKYSYEEEKLPPQILVYVGALDALKAKYVSNPFKKFKFLLTALPKLNKAVEMSSNSLEIRFIRFSVLHNLPSVLDIDEKRNEDLKIVVTELLKKNYSEINKNRQKGVIEFLIKSNRLDDIQTKKINQLYSTLINE